MTVEAAPPQVWMWDKTKFRVLVWALFNPLRSKPPSQGLPPPMTLPLFMKDTVLQALKGTR